MWMGCVGAYNYGWKIFTRKQQGNERKIACWRAACESLPRAVRLLRPAVLLECQEQRNSRPRRGEAANQTGSTHHCGVCCVQTKSKGIYINVCVYICSRWSKAALKGLSEHLSKTLWCITTTFHFRVSSWSWCPSFNPALTFASVHMYVRESCMWKWLNVMCN